ncbi:MAG TPA: TlpA disulfide reductase family protein [Flavobacteriales bacterium]|nr:TlpA disulfide reductase family protein [Flavobacteriales bacterium]
MIKSALFLALLMPVLLSAQLLDNSRPIPSVEIKTLDGKTINTSTFENGGKPIIINFWATWCKPCIAELTNIDEVYEEWIKETGVKVIAISIDDSRNATKVAPFVSGKGWTYEVYSDPNSDFKRALNVNNPPQTFLINGNKEIVWQHNGYQEGSEVELYELVKKLAEGKPLNH